jgi:DNA-directed RNA polymerase subunit RPC12/RpoP
MTFMMKNYNNKKYNKYKGYDPRNNKVVILAEDEEGNPEYICPHCNFIIHTHVAEAEDEIWCNHCQMSLLVEKTRHKSRLETPKGRNTDTLVSTTPMPGYGDIQIKKQPNYKGAFAELSKRYMV